METETILGIFIIVLMISLFGTLLYFAEIERVNSPEYQFCVDNEYIPDAYFSYKHDIVPGRIKCTKHKIFRVNKICFEQDEFTDKCLDYNLEEV